MVMFTSVRRMRKAGWHGMRRFGFEQLLTAVVLLMLLSSVGMAQSYYRMLVSPPDFTRYPEIIIPFEIIDNRSSADTVRADRIRIWENGVEMFPVSVSCDEYTVAGNISFMFLMDVSFSMAFKDGSRQGDPDSVKWRTAKNVFIDAYQRLRDTDEAALASFAADFDIEYEFTSDKQALANATRHMELRSGTSIYDAVKNAVNLLLQRDGKRVIILLTDGVDNSSHHTLLQAVQHAWNHGIPVHVIGLGFYPDQSDPFRVDTDTLRLIAERTGGRAYFTPRSDELAEIFERIIEGIYSISCIARYPTADSCSDGVPRMVTMFADVDGIELRSTFSYVRPDLRSRVRLSLGLPDEMSHERLYSVPVIVEGELRGGEEMQLEFNIYYDPIHVEYRGLQDGADILNASDLLVTGTAPGVLRVVADAAMPRRAVSYQTADVLTTLQFYVLQHEMLSSSVLSLDAPQGRQHCDILLSGAFHTVNILGCPPDAVLHIDESTVLPAGEISRIPIVLNSALDRQQALRASFAFVHDNTLEYIGHDVRGTVLEGAVVTETRDAGMVSFDVQATAPALGHGTLLYLLFRATMTKESRRAPLTAMVTHFTQYPEQYAGFVCDVPVTVAGARVWIDGICEPLLRRVAVSAIRSIHPQPSSAASGSVEIELLLDGEDAIDLRLVDASGKTAGIIADGVLPNGSTTIRYSTAHLVPGLYIVILRQGETISTKKLLLTR
jgi:hypothetical protein